MDTQNPNTQQPADSSKISRCDGEAAERVIQAAAQKARELAASLAPSKLSENLSGPAAPVVRPVPIAPAPRSSPAAIRRAAEHLFAESGCPLRHTLDLASIDEAANPRWAETRDTLVDRSGFGGYLIALLGPRGTGKTQLCVSLIHRVCGCGYSARYVKAMDLFRSLRQAYSVGAGISEDEALEKWVGCHLLVIDEAHQRAQTDWEQNILTNLIDRRYDDLLCTVLIANQSKADFAAAVGDSIVSRIYQAGEAMVCDWPSFRKPGMWRKP